VQQLGNRSELDTSVGLLSLNLQLVIGHVKNYGQEKGEAQSHLRKIDKENISIFV